MQHELFRLIDERFVADLVTADKMDLFWADGWRHFGTQFFRYNVGFLRDELRLVLPLRIDLANFRLSKSQRRVLRRNEDLDVEIAPVSIDRDAEELFDRHKERFDHSVPDSLYNFLSPNPSYSPCEAKQIIVRDNGVPVAISYMDVGLRATSGIYAMFEPAMTGRSLGIFTLLKEIEYSIDQAKEFYYLGYAYEGESFYDYKKRFRGTETFDWNQNWMPYDKKSA
jgi:Putative arginyl-tRNA:protein arginylyltransferase